MLNEDGQAATGMLNGRPEACCTLSVTSPLACCGIDKLPKKGGHAACTEGDAARTGGEAARPGIASAKGRVVSNGPIAPSDGLANTGCGVAAGGELLPAPLAPKGGGAAASDGRSAGVQLPREVTDELRCGPGWT